MDAKKRKKLEAKGWKIGSPQDFLGLSDDEALFIEIKLALARAFADLRKELRYTQGAVAQLLGSSQSRVAKMEAGDSTVSIDLLTRGLLVLGASRADLARMLKPSRTRSTKTKVAKKRRKKTELVSQ